MIIRNSNGTAIGTKSNVMIIDNASAQNWLYPNTTLETTVASPNLSQNDVAIWGENNLLPSEMWQDVENTGVLSATIETKARIAIGKGPLLAKVVGISKDGQEELEFVIDPMINDWLEMSNMFEDSFALCKDLLGLGNGFDQLLLSKDRKQIVGFKRHDAAECRFSTMNKSTRRSELVYLSSDWSQYASTGNAKKDEHMGQVELLDKSFPLYDLQSRSKGHNFMLSAQYPLFGRKYYAMPLWYPARQWVKATQAIPSIKAAMMRNQISIKYIVEIHPLFWEAYDVRYKTADQKAKKQIVDEFYDKIEASLSGAENAYKSLFSTTIVGIDGKSYEGIKITTIDDKLKEGNLLVDGAAGNSEILFAMLMNPALIGADTPGGPYSGGAGSGSNIREAFLSQVIMAEIERKLIGKRFNLAKLYNGWNRDYVLRFPNQLLTTLNTGANSKPIS
jgi:hypothetical protein